ncbi:MAG: hypothetical protein P8Y28_13080 [Gammaproteobacteria bacterium]
MSDTDQQNHQGLSVAPSPFNAVKLELAIILVAGILLWAVVDSITPSESAQIGILMLFGFLGAGWLVIRTRYLSRRISKK